MLTEDHETNGIGQLLGHAGDDAAAEKFGQRVSLRRADDQIIHAERRGKIENGRGSVIAHGIDGQDANTALFADSQHERHDGTGLWIVLPSRAPELSAAAVENGNLLHVEHAEGGLAQLCFVEGKAQHRR